MSYRKVNVNKLKSKRKKNQYINEFIDMCRPELMISKKEFKRRHKQKIVNMFEVLGYTDRTRFIIMDSISCAYWYEDPVCYKTELDNLDYLSFDERFDELFGEDMKYNKIFLNKMKKLNNKRMHAGL